MTDSKTSTELLPCPFCGGEAIYVTHTHYYDDEDTVCVFCNTCKSLVILEQNEAEGINNKTKAEAIAAWNTRAERTCEIYRVGNTQDIRKCSACDALMNFSHPLDRCHLNFCPNCGARVEEEK